MFASLLPGHPLPAGLGVGSGAAAAFAVHTGIAVTVGPVAGSCSRRAVVQGVVAALFLAGSAYLWVSQLRGRGRREGNDCLRGKAARPRRSAGGRAELRRDLPRRVG